MYPESGLSDFTNDVPAGEYLCAVVEVRPGVTRNGDTRWALKLVIDDGPLAGRFAAWDSIVFSARGRPRARRILGILGLPARGRVHVEPDELVGRKALVEIRPIEFESPSGELVRRNEVAYDGFRPVS